MKVLEVTNVDFSLAHFLVPLMLAIQAEGHEVVGVCADGPLLAGVRAQGLRVVPVPMARSLSPLAQWRAFRALLALMRAEKPDLVHAHMPISGFLARLAARCAGVPRVAYTCHGFLFNQPGPWWRRTLALVMEWLGGRMTDVLLTVSEDEAADARRLGIGRAVAVRNGRDGSRYRPNPAARAHVRAGLGVDNARCVVVIVSRLVRHKGHPELVAAMAQLPDAELWVVGERLPSDHGEDIGPLLDQPHVRRLGYRTNVADVLAAADIFALPSHFEGLPMSVIEATRVRRLGYRTDVADVLAAADIFALPSHFEGLPMSVIEAMLTGLPVVATNIRGPREQVLDGETGLLVPPFQVQPLADALTLLAGSAALRLQYGGAGRLRALALYNEPAVLARTLDLLGLDR